MITVTDNAASKIAELIIEETDAKGIRVFVQGGGCAGFSYGFAWEAEIAEDDFVVDKNDVKFIVDSMSMQYLQGATVDFKEDLQGSNFVINNPNAQTSCGCGSSFSV